MAPLLAGVLAAWTAAVGVYPAAAAESFTISQEIALDGLAISAQTLRGSRGVAETFFPPPSAPLAPGGSFVRVFFGYSPQAAQGSTMVIAFNGQPLNTVELTRGHATGGVLEVRVPTSLIDQQHPNRLQVRFDLRAPPGSQELLYGRVDATTLIHYSLARAASGIPGLETYPHSLLATDASRPASPTLAMMLPSPPDMTEAAAAFRILADLGRRAATQRVRVRVIPPSELSTPETQGAGVVLVGRLDRLPAADRVLASAGWHSAPDGWAAPDGRVARATDGMLVMALSPWDGRTPVLLVTGATNSALARAAASLAAAQPPPASSFAIAAVEPVAAGDVPRSLQVTGPDAPYLAATGPGAYRGDLSFVAPPVARDEAVSLSLTIPSLGMAGSRGRAVVSVNGSQVISADLEKGSSRSTTLKVDFPGHHLRPGRNSLALDLQRQAGAGSEAGGGLVTAMLRLPAAPPGGPDLGVLPFPLFVDSQQSTRFLLADLTPATLTAAAQAAVALGSRAAGPPLQPEAALAADPGAVAGSAHLLVVGPPEVATPLKRMAGGLPPPVPPGTGQVAETRSGQRTVLWLIGSGEGSLNRAVSILYDPKLAGKVASVDTSGKVSIGPAGETTGAGNSQAADRPEGSGTVAVAVLIATVAVVLVTLAVMQLLRARRVAA